MPERGVGRRDGGPLHPAQQDVHARRQLPHREGLGHVVVGTDAEPDQHVGLVVARGEHHHRHGAGGLHAPADLQAVEAGQHDVEDQQVGLPRLGRVDRGRTVTRRLHEESLGPQAGRDGVHDRRVVLDDQDPALCAGVAAEPLWEVCVCSIARPWGVLSRNRGVIPSDWLCLRMVAIDA